MLTPINELFGNTLSVPHSLEVLANNIRVHGLILLLKYLNTKIILIRKIKK